MIPAHEVAQDLLTKFGGMKMDATVKNTVLRMRDVLMIVKMSRSWVYAEMKLGRFPKPAFKFSRTVAWDAEDIHMWVDSHRL